MKFSRKSRSLLWYLAHYLLYADWPIDMGLAISICLLTCSRSLFMFLCTAHLYMFLCTTVDELWGSSLLLSNIRSLCCSLLHGLKGFVEECLSNSLQKWPIQNMIASILEMWKRLFIYFCCYYIDGCLSGISLCRWRDFLITVNFKFDSAFEPL